MKKILGLAFLMCCFLAPALALAQVVATPTPIVDWESKLVDLVAAALMAGLTFVAGKAVTWFNAHSKTAISLYGASVFARLSSAALTSVQAVEQIAQKDLATGVTKANAAQLKADALAYMKTLLGPQGLAELAAIVGLDQIAAALNTHIESAVLQVNQASVTQTATAKS